MRHLNSEVAAGAIVDEGAWLGELRRELFALLAGVFAQARSRLAAFAYVGALLAEPGDRRVVLAAGGTGGARHAAADAGAAGRAPLGLDGGAGRGHSALNLKASAPLRTVVRVGQPLTERVVAPVAMSLPVQRGQVLGHVQVWAGGRLVGSRPLVATRAVSAPGLAGRMKWYARVQSTTS